MSESHISYIKVENFKRFESFEMNNIGQFNIIVGDNNVGKTSVLEALLVNSDFKKFYLGLISVLVNKKIVTKSLSPSKDYLSFFNNINNSGEISFTIKSDDQKEPHKISLVSKEKVSYQDASIVEKIKFLSALNPENSYVYEYEVEGKTSYHIPDIISIVKNNTQVPYVSYGMGYNSDLINFYSSHIQQSKNALENFKNKLKIFIQDVESIEIVKDGEADLLSLRVKGYDNLIPLAQYGEGSIKLFRILLEIVASEKSNFPRLMIDEIDTGIHHQRFIPFLKTVIKSCVESNIQLFATTHNIECLKFFRDVFLEKELAPLKERARIIRLVEHKDKQVSAYSYNFDEFNNAIENENELR